MKYLTKEYVEFFRGLHENNDRDWFLGHKKEYDAYVKEPFENFIGAIIEEMREIDPAIEAVPRDTIFRINRDVRFSKDKTPYKTYMSAAISRIGKKDLRYPGLYISIGQHGVTVGGGLHDLDKDDLYTVRQAIQNNMKEFAGIVEDKVFKKMYGEMKGDKNKVMPKEFKEDVEKQPLLANKAFYAMADYNDPEMIVRKKDQVDFIMNHYRMLQPLNRFLKQALNI